MGERKSLRVLLADDHSGMRTAVGDLLEHMGHQVVAVVGDGAAAASLFTADRKRFDLVVTDFHMPRASGKDLLRIIRGSGSDMPVVIMTGEEPRAVGVGDVPNTVVISKGDVEGGIKQAIERLFSAA